MIPSSGLPYAILTRLIELVGWTRLELNKLVSFFGVTAESLNSIMRRTLVCIMKARFVDQQQLDKTPDASAKGVLLKDPTLKSFVKSSSV
eukprot:1274259-Karenia_brevis.AAC.1